MLTEAMSGGPTPEYIAKVMDSASAKVGITTVPKYRAGCRGMGITGLPLNVSSHLARMKETRYLIERRRLAESLTQRLLHGSR